MFALYPPLASLIGVRSRTLVIMFFLAFFFVSVFFCVCAVIFILCLLCVSGTECSFGALTLVFDWREQPPFWFVGLLLRKCETDKDRTVG
jgi:hypothetical protein